VPDSGEQAGPRRIVFEDLDGDRRPDLFVRAVRPDLIDQLRAASSESIDSELYVYRNRRGVFSKQPDISWSHAIPLQRFQLTSQFCGDLTGDGLSELLVRDEPTKLSILLMRAQGARENSTWSLFPKPLWELRIDKSAEIEIVPPRKGERTALLIVEPAQVLWVTFP